MDGKGRAKDNIFIERFWRTIKYDYIYLNPAENGLALYREIDTFIKRYNKRKHQGINRKKPINLFASETKNKRKSA
jgi:putative transposase